MKKTNRKKPPKKTMDEKTKKTIVKLAEELIKDIDQNGYRSRGLLSKKGMAEVYIRQSPKWTEVFNEVLLCAKPKTKNVIEKLALSILLLHMETGWWLESGLGRESEVRGWVDAVRNNLQAAKS